MSIYKEELCSLGSTYELELVSGTQEKERKFDADASDTKNGEVGEAKSRQE